MIYGNTEGIKRTTLNALENLIGNYDKSLFIDREVLQLICETTTKINREICVYVSRAGAIMAVGVGDSSTVQLKELNLRRGEHRLSEVRLIHTHPKGSGLLSELDVSALSAMQLDCMAAIGVSDGKAVDMEVAYLKGAEADKFYFPKFHRINDDKLLEYIRYYETEYSAYSPTRKKVENLAVLVNVTTGDGDVELIELERLAETAGLKTAARILQNRSAPDKQYCAGRGKLEEVKAALQNSGATFVIFNNMLTGSQLNALENELGVSVIDRPMLILEIFAKHATSNEGKLQVELAMMKYTLPRLLGQGHELSRIGGGSGSSFTRGSGETKLETDRRRVRRSIYELSEKIEKLKAERDLRRDRRIKSGIRTVAIVGYTNAGKSTLMNNITKAGVLEADKLFATLDPVTRKIFCGIGKEYLLTDTVGFIDNLPHEFIDAFRSTLEEAAYADLLVHVIDASSPDLDRQKRVVGEVLESLGAGNKPVVTAYNKGDLIKDFALPEGENSVIISARLGTGIPELKAMIERCLFGAEESID